MRKLTILILIICLTAGTVNAMEFTAPTAPESAEQYLPEKSTTFGEDLWYVIKKAISQLQPSIAEAAGICISLIAVILLVSMMQNFTGTAKGTVDLVGTLALSLLLIQPSNSLIQLGIQTVEEISEYGKLLLPVMAASMAAHGGATASATLYSSTVLFNTFLSMLVSKLIIPMIYIYIVLCIASNAVGEDILKSMRNFVKWLMTWCLKITIYLFTGYIGITGVISGTTDAAAVKAAKLALSGLVPVVGSIISDASETILVSAGVMKNAVGVYGLVAILAMYIGPFLQIGAQYLILKVTAAVAGVFGSKQAVALVNDFSGVLGFLLAMTGTVCLLLLISTVCFMKGVL